MTTKKPTAIRKTIHRQLYILLLCLLAIGMTTSVFATNLFWVLLVANWVAEWNWKEKFSDFMHNHLLHAFLVLAAVHIVWLIGTENMSYGLFDMQKKLPLLAIPLVVLTTPAPTLRDRRMIGISYVGTVLVVSIIGMVRYLTLPDLPYRDIVPYISHIRFGLNVCFTMVLLVYACIKYRRPWIYCLNILLMLWLCLFLMMLHAYTAFIILPVIAVAMLLFYGKKLTAAARWVLSLAVAAVVIGTGILGLCYRHDYFHLQSLSAEPLKECTVNGNPYVHCHDGLIENGNYVHYYVCEKEMRQEWQKRSDMCIDSLTPVGYTVYPALLRYLGAMGVTKDSLGMTQLKAKDIQAIEKGIANPVYLQHGPRKMFYVLFYEYENYRCFRSVSNFSLLQRIELWQNAWHLFLEHPLWGVGTGDVVDVCHQRLKETDSPLKNTDLHTHNQYLNFLLAFGIVGFGVICFFFVRALSRKGRLPALFTAFLCIVLVSFVSEDTLETLAGIMFCVMGFCLLPRRNTASKAQMVEEKTPTPTTQQ